MKLGIIIKTRKNTNLFVVRDVVDEGEGPVDLLHQDQPDHLMSQRHLRHGKTEIGATFDFLGKPGVSADGKNQILLRSVSMEGDKIGKPCRGKTLPLDVKKNEKIGRANSD